MSLLSAYTDSSNGVVLFLISVVYRSGKMGRMGEKFQITLGMWSQIDQNTCVPTIFTVLFEHVSGTIVSWNTGNTQTVSMSCHTSCQTEYWLYKFKYTSASSPKKTILCTWWVYIFSLLLVTLLIIDFRVTLFLSFAFAFFYSAENKLLSNFCLTNPDRTTIRKLPVVQNK